MSSLSNPFLTDGQIADLERNTQWNRLKKSQPDWDGVTRYTCPTCGDTGTYRYAGEEYACGNDSYGMHEQLRLYRLYCLANIPVEFMRLDWGSFENEDVRLQICNWVSRFPQNRLEGRGFEIYGKHGVGKTLAVTIALKGVVKQGYTGWFCHFNKLLNIEDPDREHNFEKIQNSEVVVIDDIVAPYTAAQRNYFESTIESLLRDRVHNGLPTLTTSNLSLIEWQSYYPRIFAQLSHRQNRIELEGTDYRPDADEESKVLENQGEVRPIV